MCTNRTHSISTTREPNRKTRDPTKDPPLPSKRPAKPTEWVGGDENAPFNRREPGKPVLESGEIDVKQNSDVGSDRNDALQDEKEENEDAALSIEHLQSVHEENDSEGNRAENVGGIDKDAEEEKENH